MANKSVYIKTTLTGGATTALDSIDGSSLAHGDVAFVFHNADNAAYLYTVDISSASSEVSPRIISPDSNAGNKRWILQSLTPYRGASGVSWGGMTTRPSAGTAQLNLHLNSVTTFAFNLEFHSGTTVGGTTFDAWQNAHIGFMTGFTGGAGVTFLLANAAGSAVTPGGTHFSTGGAGGGGSGVTLHWTAVGT